MLAASTAASASFADAGMCLRSTPRRARLQEVLRADQDARPGARPLVAQTVELVPVDGRVGLGEVVVLVAAVVGAARQPAGQREDGHAGRDEQRPGRAVA